MRKSVRIALPLLIIALLAVMAGAPSAAAQAGGGPSVTMSLVSPAAQVRIDSPLPVKAAFSEPVSGFTLDDISVVNGAAGNFTGSDGDSVYTFDVTPEQHRHGDGGHCRRSGAGPRRQWQHGGSSIVAGYSV